MIKNLIIIAIIIALVFLSQQPFFNDWGQKTYSWVKGQTEGYWQSAGNYAKEQILPKIDGEVGKRKDIISDEISQEKNKISENLLEKAKNYFSELPARVFGPAPCGQQPSGQ